MLMAAGLTLAFAGLVTNVVVGVVGRGRVVLGIVGWFGEVLPMEHHETIAVAPRAVLVREPVRERVAVAALEVGELGHRAILPLEIYPYSAGIRGGVAGGVVMGGLAILHGIALHGSPWYTINILAATTMARLANADTATLNSFIPQAFAVALGIHATASILVGLLYGVMLPMFPRYPAFWAAIVAPLLWTGLLWSTLGVINPVLSARIEWGWFVLGQIAFGAVAGFVVNQTERVHTMQHLPFAVRSGVEATGLADTEHPEGDE